MKAERRVLIQWSLQWTHNFYIFEDVRGVVYWTWRFNKQDKSWQVSRGCKQQYINRSGSCPQLGLPFGRAEVVTEMERWLLTGKV